MHQTTHSTQRIYATLVCKLVQEKIEAMSSLGSTTEQRLNPSVSPVDEDRPDIFRHLTKATLYRYDYIDHRYMCIDLQSYFEGKEFKIKVLNDKGADICLEDSPFISDIKFTETQRETIRSIELKERELATTQLRSMNYDDEENWTLTFQLRGFKVNFDHSAPKVKHKSYMTRQIYFGLKNGCYGDSDFEKYDTPFERSKDIKLVNYNNLSRHLRHGNWIYIEYAAEKYAPTCLMHFHELRCKDTRILEVSIDKGGYNTLILGVLIKLSSITSPSLNDYAVHSNEGSYECGINMYEGGIALIGKQNSGVMYYGNAVEYGDVVIPDYFRDCNNKEKAAPTNRLGTVRLYYRDS